MAIIASGPRLSAKHAFLHSLCLDIKLSGRLLRFASKNGRMSPRNCHSEVFKSVESFRTSCVKRETPMEIEPEAAYSDWNAFIASAMYKAESQISSYILMII